MRFAIEMLCSVIEQQVLSRKGVILKIVGGRYIPPIEDLHLIGKRQIEFLLQIFVIGRQQPFVIVLIMRIIVRPFSDHACTPAIEPLVLPLRLNKGITIPKTLAVSPHIIDDGSRNTAFRVIVIGMDAEETRGAVVFM